MQPLKEKVDLKITFSDFHTAFWLLGAKTLSFKLDFDNLTIKKAFDHFNFERATILSNLTKVIRLNLRKYQP